MFLMGAVHFAVNWVVSRINKMKGACSSMTAVHPSVHLFYVNLLIYREIDTHTNR